MFFDAFTRFGPEPRRHGAHPWRLEQLTAEMQHCSISGALVAFSAQYTYDAMLENRRLLDRIAKHDHLFPIWVVMPHWAGDFPDPDELLDRMSEHDVRAAALCPKRHAWDLGSRTSRPLLDALERAKVLSIIQYEPETDRTAIENLVTEHPGLPVLLTHDTWGRTRETMALLRNFPNLHLAFDHFQVNHGHEFLVEHGCEDQLVFASNAPAMSMGAHRLYVDYAEVPDAVREKTSSGNLVRLLKGLTPPREIVNGNEDRIMAEARQGKPLSDLVLDAHTHMMDEGAYIGGAGGNMLDGGPDGIHRLAQRLGVDGMGIMSWNGPVSVQADEGNECVRTALDAFPDVYWGLATFDVARDSAQTQRAKLEAIFADRRFLGLKPYPEYDIAYDDPRYDVWWEFGNERHLYAAFHPVRWYEAGEFESVCSRFPDLTVIAYHCGGSYEIADVAIELARKFPNFRAEITLTPSCLGIIDYLVEGCGADRVLYGSDQPMRDPRQQLGWVVYSRLSVDDKLKVLGRNMQQIVEHIRAHQ